MFARKQRAFKYKLLHQMELRTLTKLLPDPTTDLSSSSSVNKPQNIRTHQHIPSPIDVILGPKFSHCICELRNS